MKWTEVGELAQVQVFSCPYIFFSEETLSRSQASEAKRSTPFSESLPWANVVLNFETVAVFILETYNASGRMMRLQII